MNAEIHQAHVHGEAELMLVLEHNKLAIEITTPAANLVGFEYQASTKQEKQAVAKAQAYLRQANKVFTLTGGDCHLHHSHADFSSVLTSHDQHHDDHDKHAHDKQTHEKHSDHHKEHEKHAHSDHKAHSDQHGEVTASYEFECNNASELTAITVNLFSQFSALYKINASWISTTQQGANVLTKNQAQLRLNR
ncbi:ZrgA family zinc uptake protein [Saccharobesus litoralis]|uniref:ZrgA family zinc uptake protein n=1 Tax=Saccharobesus litoralis TaxID=2172099 RepID=UPI00131F030C|nr:DUF2796 domain-containing protein [Saccharobesus litoralis]